MKTNRILLTALVAAAMVAPAAGAWSVQGSFEPDTTRDVTDDYMWTEPDTSEVGSKVYFNAVQHYFVTSTNPNVGAAKTAIRMPGHQTMAAFLGEWKDCNADGYIGMVEGAIHEYRSELLLDASVCPDGSVWNNEGWVYEFRWIGPNDIFDEDLYGLRRGINDTTARVWGDYGLPGARPGGSCAVNPLPEGTTASTGGLIAYSDCIAGRQITTNVNTVDESAGGAGLYMDPQSPQTSDSLLNQRFPAHLWYDPYGETNEEKTGLIEEYEAHRGDDDHEKSPAFSVWDCSAPSGGAEVTDPTGQLGNIEDPTGLVFDEPLSVTDDEGRIAAVPTPNPQPGNPTGSYQDALNDTESGVTYGTDHPGCEGTPTNLQGETTVEAAYGGVDVNRGRMLHDIYFTFTSSPLTPAPGSLDNMTSCVIDDVPPGCAETYILPDGTIPDSTPYEGGVGYLRPGSLGGPTWYGLPNYIRDPQLINRATLQPAGGEYVTFYASVDTALFAPGALPPAGTGVYGAEWCNGATTGVADGFDCDKTHWWNPKYDASNTDMPTQTANTDETCYDPETKEFDALAGCRDLGVAAGKEYQLRDIDCYDGMVVYNTAYASLAQVSETGVCDRPEGTPVPDVPAPSVG